MSYCTQCGQSISDGARFCTNCGEQVARRTPSAPKPDLSGTEAAEQPSAPVGDPPDPFLRSLLPAHAALLLCMPCFAFAVSEWEHPTLAFDGRYSKLMSSFEFWLVLICGVVSVLACFVFATMACKNLLLAGNSRRANSVAKWFRRSVWTLACLGFVGSSFSIYQYRPILSKEAAEVAAANKALVAIIKKRTKQLKSSPVAKEVAENMLASMVDIPGKNYKMSKTEVTQAQWETIMGENPSRFKGENNPVECVSLGDCLVFLELLNSVPVVKKSGQVFRLPWEKEWRFACYADQGDGFCQLESGVAITEDDLGLVAWFEDNSGGKTHPVGLKQPNAFGLYDVHGNVSEWTQTTAEGGSSHVYLGGSWDTSARSCRLLSRFGNSSKNEHDDLGVRLCVESTDNGNR